MRKRLILPIPYQAKDFAKISDRLPCKKSGSCCTKFNIPVFPYDIENILASGQITREELDEHLMISEDGVGRIKKPCPFLKDSLCSIYAYRPIACRLYPIQGGGNEGLSLELDCTATYELARELAEENKCLCTAIQEKS